MRKPTNPRQPCKDCGATELVYLLKMSGCRGYKGYHCPTHLATNLEALRTSYKYVTITISNSEG